MRVQPRAPLLARTCAGAASEYKGTGELAVSRLERGFDV